MNLFNLQGYLQGVLTRGKESDLLFKPRWNNPINMVAREQLRRKEATKLIQKLNLKRIVNKLSSFYDPFVDNNNIQRNTDGDRANIRRDTVSLHSTKSKLQLNDLLMQHEQNKTIEESKKFLENFPNPALVAPDSRNLSSSHSQRGMYTGIV